MLLWKNNKLKKRFVKMNGLLPFSRRQDSNTSNQKKFQNWKFRQKQKVLILGLEARYEVSG